VEVLVANAHAADAVDVFWAAFGGAVAARGTPVAHHCQHIVTLATIIISLARSIGTLAPPSTHLLFAQQTPLLLLRKLRVLPGHATEML